LRDLEVAVARAAKMFASARVYWYCDADHNVVSCRVVDWDGTGDGAWVSASESRGLFNEGLFSVDAALVHPLRERLLVAEDEMSVLLIQSALCRAAEAEGLEACYGYGWVCA
jgi:hypothetical protein